MFNESIDDVDESLQRQREAVVAEIEDQRKLKIHIVFPLFDEIGYIWPGALLKLGMYIEVLQLFAFVFNPYVGWSKTIQNLTLPLYTLILPFWDALYVAQAPYLLSAIFTIVTFVVLLLLYIVLVFQVKWIKQKNTMICGAMTRVLMFVISGPLFLPCIHHLLAHSVCNSSSSGGGGKTLAAYSSEACFSSSQSFQLSVSILAIIALVLLCLLKLTLTVFIYDSHPLTESYRGRTHSIVEIWMFAYQIAMSALFHSCYFANSITLPIAILLVFSVLMCALHVFYLPFTFHSMNRLRVIGFGCIAINCIPMLFCSLFQDNVFTHGNFKLWDCLIAFPVTLLMILVLYVLTDLRISQSFRRDVVRTLCGNADPSLQHRVMRFPSYLPTEERSEFTEKVVLQVSGGSNLHGTPTGYSSPDTISRADSLATATSGATVWDGAHVRLGASATSAWTDVFWRDHQAIELDELKLSSYIDSVYVSTDVELATRFVGAFSRVTYTSPPRSALCFAARIYAKGLARFNDSGWLMLQFATFLCAFTSHSNATALALCETLNRREVGAVMVYRLHHHINAINITHVKRPRETKRALRLALSLHKETLINIRNFWKHLASDQVSVNHLSKVTYSIIDGCYDCLNAYSHSMVDHVDPFLLARYAQFLEHVTLDAEAALNTRKIALDLLEKHETGELQRGKVSVQTLGGKRNHTGQYTKLSNQLRNIFIFLIVCIFILLGVLLFVIVSSYKDARSLFTFIINAAKCRFYVLRSYWTAYAITMNSMSNGNGAGAGTSGLTSTNDAGTPTMWADLHRDLRLLRNAHAEITINESSPLYTNVAHFLKSPFYPAVYNEETLSEEMGLWRVGETYISALETFILNNTVSSTNSDIIRFFVMNELNSAATAYNTSVQGLVSTLSSEMFKPLYGVIAIYILLLIILIALFFVFRYFMAYISNMRLSVIELFRLIPRSALQDVVEMNTLRIEEFANPDPVFEAMVAERNLSKEKLYNYYDGAKIGSSQRDANSAEAHASNMHMASSTSDDMNNSDHLYTGNHRNRNIHSGDSNTINHSNNNNNNHDDYNGSNENENDDDDDDDDEFNLNILRGSESEGGSSKFAQLYKNASLGDVGRIKFTQGEYEPPFSRDEFKPPQLSLHEAAARQHLADSAEVEYKLIHMQERMKDYEVGQADTDNRLDDLVKSNADTPRWHSYVFFTLMGFTLIVSAALVIFAILETQEKDKVQVTYTVLDAAQKTSLKMSKFVDDAEGFGFSGFVSNYQRLLTDLADMHIQNAESISLFSYIQNSELASYLGQYLATFNLMYSQLLTAVRLQCVDSPTPDNCAAFQSVSWNTNTFVPPSTLAVLFDYSLQLPTSPEVDLSLDKPARQLIIRNIFKSPYYQELKQSCKSVTEAAIAVIKDDQRQSLSQKSTYYFALHVVTVCISVLLILLVMMFAIVLCVHHPEKTILSVTVYFVFVLCLICVTCAALMYQNSLPYLSYFDKMSDAFEAVFDVYMTSFFGHSNITRAAFAEVEDDMVNYLLSGKTSFERAWSVLFNAMGSSHFDKLTDAYTQIRYAFYLDSITMVLSCSFNHFTSDLYNLPALAQQSWNISNEADGYFTQMQYANTDQLLYTTRESDEALPVEQQRKLALSLSYGPLNEVSFDSAMQSLQSILFSFTQSLSSDMESRRSNELMYNIIITIVSGIVCLIYLSSIIIYIVEYMEESVQRTLSVIAASAIRRYKKSTDSLFKRKLRGTNLFFLTFGLLISILFIIIIVHAYEMSNEGNHINVAMRRADNIILSGVSLFDSIQMTWYGDSVTQFALDSVSDAELLYKIGGLSPRSNIFDNIFGTAEQQMWRFNHSYIYNTNNLEKYQVESSILAFDNYTDPSQRRYARIVQELLNMNVLDRVLSESSIHDDVRELSELIMTMSAQIASDIFTSDTYWLIANLVVYCVIFILMCYMAWFLLSPLVHSVMKDEEGTQVMLRMIPAHIRASVPAIVEYMNTGSVARDANTSEVNLAAGEFNVRATLMLDEHGVITQFSRAAEELFLWTKSEAVGLSVAVLMPENTSFDSEQHLLHLIRLMANKQTTSLVQLLRGRRKDGTVFPAQLYLYQGRSLKGIHYIAIMRNRQADIDLDREITLAKSLSQTCKMPMLVIDQDGVILRCNAAAEETFRCTCNDVLGRYFNIILPRSEGLVYIRAMELYKTTNRKTLIDVPRVLKCKRLTGELFHGQLTVRELRHGTGVHFALYIQDLSERLQQEMMHAAIITLKNISPEPLLIANAEGKVLFASESATRLFMCSDGNDEFDTSGNANLINSNSEDRSYGEYGNESARDRSGLVNRLLEDLFDDNIITQHHMYIKSHSQRSSRNQVRHEEARIVQGFGKCVGILNQRYGVGGTDGNVNDLTTFEENEYANMTRTGLFPTRVTLRRFSVESGNKYVVYFIENLTREKNEAREAYMGAALTSLSTTPVLLCSATGEVRWMSEAAESTFGVSNGEIYGQPVDVLFVEEDDVSEDYFMHCDATQGSDNIGGNKNDDGKEKRDRKRQMFQSDQIVATSQTSSGTTSGTTANAGLHLSRQGIQSPFNRNINRESNNNSNNTTSVGQVRYKPNPIRQMLNEYAKNGITTSLHRHLEAVARTWNKSNSNNKFNVDVYIHEFEQEPNVKMYLVYIHDLRTEEKMLEMSRWKDAFMSMCTAAVQLSTLSGIITDCSESTCREFHFRRDELIGENVVKIMPLKYARNHDAQIESFRRTLRELKNINFDAATRSFLRRQAVLTGRTRDGDDFPLYLHVQELCIGGIEDFLVASLHNCLSEMTLQVERNLTRALIDLSSVPFVATDNVGMITRFSQNAVDQFGFTVEEVMGQNTTLLMPNDIANHHAGFMKSYEKTHISHVIGTGRIVTGRRKDGNLFPIGLRVHDVRTANSLSFIAFLYNVGAVHVAAKAQRVRHVLDSLIATPLLEIDVHGIITNCNDEAIRELSLSMRGIYCREDVIGRSIYDIIPQQPFCLANVNATTTNNNNKSSITSNHNSSSEEDEEEEDVGNTEISSNTNRHNPEDKNSLTHNKNQKMHKSKTTPSLPSSLAVSSTTLATHCSSSSTSVINTTTTTTNEVSKSTNWLDYVLRHMHITPSDDLAKEHGGYYERVFEKARLYTSSMFDEEARFPAIHSSLILNARLRNFINNEHPDSFKESMTLHNNSLLESQGAASPFAQSTQNLCKCEVHIAEVFTSNSVLVLNNSKASTSSDANTGSRNNTVHGRVMSNSNSCNTVNISSLENDMSVMNDAHNEEHVSLNSGPLVHRPPASHMHEESSELSLSSTLMQKKKHTHSSNNNNKYQLTSPLNNSERVTSVINGNDSNGFHLRMLISIRPIIQNHELIMLTRLNESVVALSRSPFYVVDDHGRLSFFNRAAEKEFGYTAEEAIGQSLSILVPPENAKKLLIGLKKFVTTGVRTFTARGYSSMCDFKRKNGQVFTAELFVRDLHDDGGKIHMVCCQRERTTFIATIREKALSTILLEDSPAAMIVTDHCGTITDYTIAAENLLKYSAVEVMNKNIELIPSYPVSFVESNTQTSHTVNVSNIAKNYLAVNTQQTLRKSEINAANSHNSNTNVKEPNRVSHGAKSSVLTSHIHAIHEELVITCGDGSTIQANVHIQPIYPYRSELPTYAIYFTPVVHTRQVQCRVQQISRLFTSAPNAILVLNKHGIIVECNEAAAVLFHTTSSHLLRRSIIQFTPQQSEFASTANFLRACRKCVQMAETKHHHSTSTSLSEHGLNTQSRSINNDNNNNLSESEFNQHDPFFTSTRNSVDGELNENDFTVTINGVHLRCDDASGNNSNNTGYANSHDNDNNYYEQSTSPNDGNHFHNYKEGGGGDEDDENMAHRCGRGNNMNNNTNNTRNEYYNLESSTQGNSVSELRDYGMNRYGHDVRDSTGSELVINATITSLCPYDACDEPKVVIVCEDCTMEYALAQYTTRETTVQEAAHVGVVEIGVNGVILTCAENLIRELGFKSTQIIGKSLSVLLPQEEHLFNQYIHQIQAMVQRGELINDLAQRKVLSFRRAHGAMIQMQSEIYPVFYNDGRFASVAINVTLPESLDACYDLINLFTLTCTIEPTVLVSMDGTIVCANSSLYEMFDIPFDIPLIGENVSVLFVEHDLFSIMQEVRQRENVITTLNGSDNAVVSCRALRYGCEGELNDLPSHAIFTVELTVNEMEVPFSSRAMYGDDELHDESNPNNNRTSTRNGNGATTINYNSNNTNNIKNNVNESMMCQGMNGTEAMLLITLRATEEMKEMELQYEIMRAAMTSPFHAIIAMDVSGRIIMYTGASEEIFGLSANVVSGRNALNLFLQPNDAEELKQAIKSSRRTGKLEQIETARVVTAKSFTESNATTDQSENVNDDNKNNNNVNGSNNTATFNVHASKSDSASTRRSISTSGLRVSSVNSYTGKQAGNEIPKTYKLITIQLQLKLISKEDLDVAQDLLVMYATLV